MYCGLLYVSGVAASPSPRLQCQGPLTSVLDLALASTCETVPPISAFVQFFAVLFPHLRRLYYHPKQGP